MHHLLYTFLSFSDVSATTARVLSGMKSAAIGSASASVTAALTAACFIVAFQLIRLSYNVMSDEQQGGFGGVRLWQVLRPIVIILLINNSVWAFRTVDLAVNWTVSQISGTVTGRSSATEMTTKQIALYHKLATTADGVNLIDEYNNPSLDPNYWQTAMKDLNVNPTNVREHYTEVRERAEQLKTIDITNKLNANFEANKDILDKGAADLYKAFKDVYSNPEFINDPNKVNQLRDELTRVFGEIESKKTQEDLRDFSKVKDVIKLTWNEIISLVALKAYEIMTFCIMLFADIQMLILAVFFPWALVLSLFSQFKTALWHYVTSYLTAGMTKVVAQCINWTVGGAASILSQTQIDTIIKSFMNADQATGALGHVNLTSALIYLTGFIALTKCGSIVQMLIPGASGASDTSAGGLAAASMAKSGVTKGAKITLSGAGKGANAAKEVTNALGKIAGGGGS